MFEALYALVGAERNAWLGLRNEASRLFFQEFATSTSDRAHPHWAVRPLSISHLASLWPAPEAGRASRATRSLTVALETELLARSIEGTPDVAGYLVEHPHTLNSQCTICAQYARDPLVQAESLHRMAERVFKAIAEDDLSCLPALANVLASELITKGASRRHLHRTALTFVLDPSNRHTGDLADFDRRLAALIEPSDPPPDVPARTELFRALGVKCPKGFNALLQAPSINSSHMRIQRRSIAVSLGGIADRSNAIEVAAEEIRSASEIWLSYLRLALAEKATMPSGVITVLNSNRLSTVHPAVYRRLWSGVDAGRSLRRLLDARAGYCREDQERMDAGVAWIGIALVLLNENPARAAGLVWMGLEAAYGGRKEVQATGARLYASRLRLELAYEIARYVTRLKVLLPRDHGANVPVWLKQAPSPVGRIGMQAYLESLSVTLEREASDQEAALKARVSEVRGMYADSAARRGVAERTRRDLALLYCVRNGFAHAGSFTTNESMSHYLATLGLEVFKSWLSQLIAFWSRRQERTGATSVSGLFLVDALSSASTTPRDPAQ